MTEKLHGDAQMANVVSWNGGLSFRDQARRALVYDSVMLQSVRRL